MAIYRCEGCGRLVDDDYDPMDENFLCEACQDELPVCSECGERCETVEESFDYAGTHCNYGKSGTHHTGHYVSKCCLAEIKNG